MKNLTSLFALSIVLCTFEASATVTHPGFNFRVMSDGVAGTGEACNYGSVTQVAPTEWFYSGSYQGQLGSTISWAYLVDPDPFITGTFSLTNETAISKAFVVDFSLPISPAMSQSIISGQMSGTLTDANGSGFASMTSTSGGPVYSALADDAFVQGLMSNANQTVNSAFGTTSFSGGSFGQGSTLYGPAINSTIGIRFAFTLSAGDSVSFSSIFVANPVPAPGAIALVGFAGAFVSTRRRRV